MTKINYYKVNFNSGLLLKELEKKKIQVSPIGYTEIYKASYKGHKELVYDIATSLMSFPAGWLLGDKFYTKKFLEKYRIPVAPGKVFNLDSKKQALKYAASIGFPIVIKPLMNSHGEFVYSGIENKKELDEKIDIICDELIGSGNFLLEKHVFGEEYRIFYAKDGCLAGVHRIPANITGDGKQSILALIQAENYRRMNPRISCLCEIKLDDILFDHLLKKGLNIDHIPKKDEKIQLRLSSNISKGGNCFDITNKIHSSILKLSDKILKIIPDISYIGIDLICDDISKPLNKQNYAICELNPIPGLSLHSLPEKGKSRNVALILANLLFPEIK